MRRMSGEGSAAACGGRALFRCLGKLSGGEAACGEHRWGAVHRQTTFAARGEATSGAIVPGPLSMRTRVLQAHLRFAHVVFGRVFLCSGCRLWPAWRPTRKTNWGATGFVCLPLQIESHFAAELNPSDAELGYRVVHQSIGQPCRSGPSIAEHARSWVPSLRRDDQTMFRPSLCWGGLVRCEAAPPGAGLGANVGPC